jgi:hypothetical protein
MSYVARSSRVLPVPAEVAFDTLADHDSWFRWMPASFRPAGRPLGRLSVGMKLRVKILGSPLPASIRVMVVDRPRELTWGGGVPGLIMGRHRFLFEPKGDTVEVQSVETWSGVLAALVRRGVLPMAEKVGREQLEALEQAMR